MTKQHMPYDEEELVLMNEIEQGQRASIKDLEDKKEQYAHYATNTINMMNKRKAISIRIFEEDLIKIKAKAQSLGIPYQTYITSQIRKMAA